jgi:ABC-type lipoprotein export system ATPase subunit
MDLIKELRKDQKVTFVVVTHDPIVIAQCDRVYAVRDGKVTHELGSKELESAVISDKYNRALDGIY